MKLTKTTTKRLLVYAIPFFILAGMTAKPLMTNLTGDTVVLETSPLDPRDLFRGDHVLLDLAIQEVQQEKLSREVVGKLHFNDLEAVTSEAFDVYVLLSKGDDGVFEVSKVVTEKPDTGIYLKGTVDPWVSEEEGKTISIHYELDRYFVPENTGRTLEKAATEGRALVTMKVRHGYAVIQEVSMDENL